MVQRLSGEGVWWWCAVAALAVLATTAMSESALVPSLPASGSLNNSPLYNIWSHALRNQKNARGELLRSDKPGPQTMLAPAHGLMTNMVPMDSVHPLYHPDYAALRTKFLLDYMIQEAVSPDDARMQAPEGLTVTNLNGEKLTFRRDAQGIITVEGVTATDVKTHPDGVVSYTLNAFLFGRDGEVRVAWEDLKKRTPKFGPLGAPLPPE